MNDENNEVKRTITITKTIEKQQKMATERKIGIGTKTKKVCTNAARN